MLFSMLGSLFSSRRDFTKVITRRPVQTEPYNSDLPGFNTRFSLYDLECRVENGRGLTPEERKYYNYIKGL
ncbi:hypothetical protein SCREM2_gp68 [Synechococcus phage S-CREM2]|nr:hypothetical protein SCREM2_gp68 [Synechococcus phage S-CREM2]